MMHWAGTGYGGLRSERFSRLLHHVPRILRFKTHSTMPPKRKFRDPLTSQSREVKARTDCRGTGSCTTMRRGMDTTLSEECGHCNCINRDKEARQRNSSPHTHVMRRCRWVCTLRVGQGVVHAEDQGRTWGQERKQCGGVWQNCEGLRRVQETQDFIVCAIADCSNEDGGGVHRAWDRRKRWQQCYDAERSPNLMALKHNRRLKRSQQRL